MHSMIPYFKGRVGHGWDQLGTRTSDVDYTALLKTLQRRPLDYFRLFYADTALFGAEAATASGLSFFRADHVLFSSDTPFEPEPGVYIPETIDIIDRWRLPTKCARKLRGKRPGAAQAELIDTGADRRSTR